MKHLEFKIKLIKNENKEPKEYTNLKIYPKIKIFPIENKIKFKINGSSKYVALDENQNIIPKFETDFNHNSNYIRTVSFKEQIFETNSPITFWFLYNTSIDIEESYEIELIQNKPITSFADLKSIKPLNLSTPIYYRGESKYYRDPDTTLHRYLKEHKKSSIDIIYYLLNINDLKSRIYSETNIKFEQTDFKLLDENINNIIQSRFNEEQIVNSFESNYLIFLRQYGFHSPLLDVTRSSTIALYFAVESLSDCPAKIMFIYDLPKDGYPANSSNGNLEPLTFSLNTKNKYMETKRHYTQQSEYLLSYQTIDNKVIPRNIQESESFFIDTYIIPKEYKKSILKDLIKEGINKYSIYKCDNDYDKLMDMFKQEDQFNDKNPIWKYAH